MAHALASELKDDTAPPRIGWERPPEEMGYVAVEDFRRGEPWWAVVGYVVGLGWQCLVEMDPQVPGLVNIQKAMENGHL